MPNWKKVITSGSNAELNQITASSADINGGTIDGITSLTAGGNLDIGSHDFQARDIVADGGDIRLGPNDSDGILLRNPTQETFTVTNPDDTGDHYLEVTGNGIVIPGGSQYLDLQGTTDATNASGDTGILRVEGGASIAKKVFVGTQLSVGSHITASGIISASVGVETHHLFSPTLSDLELQSFGNLELDSGGNIELNADAGNVTFADGEGGTKVSVNTTDGHITASGNISASGFVSASHFSGDGSGLTNVSATATPAGSDTQVQFNDGGSLGGDSGLVYNKTSDTLTATNIGAFNLTGKLTAGSTEIEGTAFDINGGVIDSTTIGGSTAAAGTFTLLTGTNITASGNISSSGTIQSTGNISTDGNIDASGDATFGTITMTGKIDTSGEVEAEHLHSTDDIEIGDSLFHSGDTDTKIQFAPDQISFIAGNETLITLTESTQDVVIIGDGGDVDFHVKAGGTNTLFAQGSSNRIGIGTNSPSSKLEVDGDITATSHITASGNISASGDIINTGNITTNDPTITYASASIVTLANGEGYGEIIDLFPAHGSVNAGDVVFHLGSVGTVWRTGANSSDYTVNMAGVALEAGDGSTPARVLTRGVVRLAAGHIEDTSGANGEPLYSGDTAGHVQFAVPGSSGEYARILGYCLVEDDDIIYFNPDNAYVERS